MSMISILCMSQIINNNNNVGTPGGYEVAVHSACRYLETMPADHVMVKLDFANAFNSLHRYDMLLFIHA